MTQSFSISGPEVARRRASTTVPRGLRAALALTALAALAGCFQRRADGTRGTDSGAVDTASRRVDTVVRVDTVLVRDSLTAIGDTVGASSAMSSATAGAAPVVPLPPASGGVNPPPVTPAAMAALAARRIIVPIAGIPAAKLPDTFDETRGGTRRHEALDIMAPRDTPIHSADDGSVLKLFTSKAGGLTVYATDPAGRFIYYYAHLDHYAPGLHEGQPLHRGDVIGYVGSTGDASADAPHLHFAIALSSNVKEWWKGTDVDPTPVLQASAARVPP